MEFIITHKGKNRRLQGNFSITGTKKDLLVLYGVLKEQAQAIKEDSGTVSVNAPNENLGAVIGWED